MRSKFLWFCILSCFSCLTVNCLPTALIEDVKANELKDNKVKRLHSEVQENLKAPVAYYDNPTAIKRGLGTLNGWDSQSKDSLLNLAPSLYSPDESQFEDEKSLLDYEKGYRYGTNREKLDKDLENAVLKSEIYGNPAYYNQYRLFEENNEDKKRKRRAIKNIRLGNRYKRDIELTPEEVLTLLSLWDNEPLYPTSRDRDYKPAWFRYGQDDENDVEDNSMLLGQDDDEDWLDTPVVYPHASNRIVNQIPGEIAPQEAPNYIYEDKRGRWGRFQDNNSNKKKRFMVARKRSDPTRELRYLNGPPQKNDFYTLSQLLATAPHEPNVPLYHRLVL